MASLSQDDAVESGAQFAAATQSSRPGTAGDGRHSADSIAYPAVVSTATAPSPTSDANDMVHILDFSSTDHQPTGRLFPVEKLTTCSDALKEMEDLRLSATGNKGKGSADQTSEAHRFRWIHFPDTNIRWAQAALPGIRAHVDELTGSRDATVQHSGFYTKEFFDARSNAFKTGRLHARFMKPFAHKWIDRNQARTELVLMMPYIHWEAKEDYDKMRECVEHIERRSLPHPLPTPQARFYKSLEQSDEDIHIRRSLDQSYYWSLPDTKRRDNDQVVTRYHAEPKFKSHAGPASHAPAPLLMVDQLWLWVFNGDQNNSTVVSFFPRTWGESNRKGDDPLREDRLDVFSEMLRFFLESPKAKKCTNSMKLAFHIIDRCAGNVVDEKLTPSGDQQYIEHFNRYIDGLMDDHKSCLEDFDDEMQAAQKHTALQAAEAAAAENRIAPSFEIDSEFKILKDIRDIEEELLMMRHVVEEQEHALALLQHQYRHDGAERQEDEISWDGMTHTATTLPSPSAERRDSRAPGLDFGAAAHGIPSDAGSPSPHRLSSFEPALDVVEPQTPKEWSRGRAGTIPPITITATSDARPRLGQGTGLNLNPRPAGLADLLSRAEKRYSILRKLSFKAYATEKSIIRLLDMKQRQANILEARSTRQIAEASERQSEAIMLFTIITIVFLPLGTIASIYGMNADEFGNKGGPKLEHIWKVLFGVSVPLAIVILYLAFHRRFRRILGLLAEYLWLKATHKHCFALLISWEDQLQTAVEELEEQSGINRKPKLDAIDKKKKRRKERREQQKAKREASTDSHNNREASQALRQKYEKGKKGGNAISTSAAHPSADEGDSDANHDSNDTTITGALEPGTQRADTNSHSGGKPHRSERKPNNMSRASDSSRKRTGATNKTAAEPATDSIDVQKHTGNSANLGGTTSSDHVTDAAFNICGRC